MATEKNGKKKASFFSNRWNIVLTCLTIVLLGVVLYRWEIIAKNIEHYTSGRADPADIPGQIGQEIKRGFQTVTDGCAKPPAKEVEAHFSDNNGSIPVAPDFDADPGELCGNGKSLFCTSVPPKKAIPSGWESPPRPGSDPNYQGPAPGSPFKESPYAMPSPKITLNRFPVRDLDESGFDKEFKKAVARAPGKVGYLGARDPAAKFGHLGPHLVKLEPGLFNGDDDEVVATKLLAKGIDFVLLDRSAPTAGAWIEEKMNQVGMRLRDAVSLAWFHPVVLGSGYAAFRVAPPFVIPKHIKRRITGRIRQKLAGEKPDAVDFNPPISAVGDNVYRVLVSLRWRSEAGLKGRKLTKKIANGKTLISAIDNATKGIIDGWERIRQKALTDSSISVNSVPKEIAQAIGKMEIEVDVFHDMCAITDKTPRNMVWYLELALEGLTLRGEDTLFYLEPSYALQYEISSEIVFLEKLLLKNRNKNNKLSEFLRDAKNPKTKNKRPLVLYESKWKNADDYRLGRFRAVRWLEEAPGADIVELYRGIPLKTIWDVTREALVGSLEAGAQWLMFNQTDDGQYAYKYYPANKPGRRWFPGGNIVRHALNPYTLLMVNKIKQDPRYVESAKKGIAFTLKFLRKEGNRCLICHRDPPARYYNAKLNAVAVTILSILKLGAVADISEYDEVLKCMAEEMLFMQDPNGHFWQYDVPPDHPYYGAESTIHAGEFIFVLARLYSHYKEERYKVACDKAIKYYMQMWRKLEKERTPHGIYDEEHRVNLIGIVPWLVTAMNDLHLATGDDSYAQISYETQGWIDNEFFWYTNRAQYPDYVGSSFKVHKELPAVNSCQYAEGAAAAYEIAKRTGHKTEERRKLLIHSMRFCLQLQYADYGSTYFLPIPKEAMGGYRYTLGHTRLRNDYNYHAMAAIAQAVEYLLPSDYPAERPMRIPPVLRELLGGVPNPEKDAPRPSDNTPSPQDEPPVATEPTEGKTE